jgi:hypothetical protein
MVYLVVWAIVLLNGLVFADGSQLKIVDGTGLTRAVRVLRSKAIVEVSVRSGLSESTLQLVPIDRPIPSLSAIVNGETAEFRGVLPGVWRISLSSKELVRVKIREEE